MAVVRKVLKKVGIKLESVVGTAETANFVLMPWTSFTLNQSYDMIKDESIVGVAFEDLPIQGLRKIEGELSGQLDVLSSETLFEIAFGAVTSKAFSLPADKNVKTMTVIATDDLQTYTYAGCFIKKLTISSKVDGALEFKADVVGYVAEVRDSDAFPTVATSPGTRLRHIDANGTGYIRIGDQTDALAAGDNVGLKNIDIEIDWQTTAQYDNTSQSPLLLLSGQGGRPEASVKFEVSRLDSDNWFSWKEGNTALQAELYFYKSATASIKIQLTNFVLSKAEATNDDIPGVSCEGPLCRNGTGTSYSNANMAFVTPVKLTLDNA